MEILKYKNNKCAVLYSNGRLKYIKKINMLICPTLLAGLYKGTSTYGIVAIVEKKKERL